MISHVHVSAAAFVRGTALWLSRWRQEPPPRVVPLTTYTGSEKRELQALALIAEGLSIKQIAIRLISFKTVACHRSHILANFGVHKPCH